MKELFREWDDAHAGHRERLRQRVEYSGFDGMQPHEVIEFLLCYTIPRQDVNALAHELIKVFGSVDGVLHAGAEKLSTVKGLGRKTACFLEKIGELTDAYNALGPGDSLRLKDVRAMFTHACALYGNVQPPATWQLCLSGDTTLLYQRELCPSRAWGEPETLRQALRDVLCSGARCAVLIQFIGNQEPQAEGYDLTHAKAYAETLRAARCELKDIVLIGARGTLSLRADGYIPAQDMRTDYSGALSEGIDTRSLRINDKEKETGENTHDL